jgi:hypothetical protein
MAASVVAKWRESGALQGVLAGTLIFEMAFTIVVATAFPPRGASERFIDAAALRLPSDEGRLATLERAGDGSCCLSSSSFVDGTFVENGRNNLDDPAAVFGAVVVHLPRARRARLLPPTNEISLRCAIRGLSLSLVHFDVVDSKVEDGNVWEKGAWN